jgi:hypothetical protein
VAHQLRRHEGIAPTLKGRERGNPPEEQRPFWYCTCCRREGPGWVCYITQPRPKGGTGGKPDRQEAERLHRRHIEDVNISEEAWW